ncbi:MAG: hypothetical protein U5K69_15085 [Balneolaceae bacterium]|nr:hypothetical protein [Balneolaceae bacterium]
MIRKHTGVKGFLLFVILAFGQAQFTYAQTEETWLRADGGYLSQRMVPVDLKLPVYQKGEGFSMGISLYFDLQDSYHKARAAYGRNQNLELLPSGIASMIDRSISLVIDYEYTHFHFRNVADLHVDIGSGPYFFVQNQITDFHPTNNQQVRNNALHYGGGVNLIFRYNHPNIPANIRFNVVNGGFLGNKELNQQDDNRQNSSANGWFSKADLRLAYRFRSRLGSLPFERVE